MIGAFYGTFYLHTIEGPKKQGIVCFDAEGMPDAERKLRSGELEKVVKQKLPEEYRRGEYIMTLGRKAYRNSNSIQKTKAEDIGIIDVTRDR